MKKQLIFLLFLLLAVTTSVKGQVYLSLLLPDSLKANASAVVRLNETEFVQTDINNATVKFTTVITVLKEGGREYADIFIQQDKFHELKSFSGAVLDPITGKVIKKISKADLYNTAYSSEVASDSKYSIYEHYPSSYPFTIKYEYEIRYKSGVASYPLFIPQVGYGISVEKATYTIQVPENQKIRYKASNMAVPNPVVQQKGQSTVYTWSVNNIKAITRERLSPGIRSLVPTVLLAPGRFCVDGYCGNMESWKGLGLWVYELQKGRNTIPESLKQTLVEMTKDIPTEKEKVKKVYEYLQSTTRYVSIQLGIGGWQTAPAESVAKNGYGDCKALSNYMAAMLEAIGIPSIYTVISTKHTDVYTDFASLTQMDHIVLAVPLTASRDTLWLECTSAVMPFNYLHSNIAGHQALLIKPEGGELCRLPKPVGIANNELTNLTVKVDENGDGVGTAYSEYKLESYEDMLGFVHVKNEEERRNFLAENFNLPKVRVSDIQFTAHNTEAPNLQITCKMSLDKFANKSGNRLFIPFSPLRMATGLALKDEPRKYDLVLLTEMLQTDTLLFELPANYTAENIPKPASFNSLFGDYSVETILDGNTLKVTQRLYMKQGRYAPEKAAEFREFLRKVERESTRKAVFKLNN